MLQRNPFLSVSISDRGYAHKGPEDQRPGLVQCELTIILPIQDYCASNPCNLTSGDDVTCVNDNEAGWSCVQPIIKDEDLSK